MKVGDDIYELVQRLDSGQLKRVKAALKREQKATFQTLFTWLSKANEYNQSDLEQAFRSAGHSGQLAVHKFRFKAWLLDQLEPPVNMDTAKGRIDQYYREARVFYRYRLWSSARNALGKAKKACRDWDEQGRLVEVVQDEMRVVRRLQRKGLREELERLNEELGKACDYLNVQRRMVAI